MNPVMYAVSGSNLRSLQALLLDGASINYQDAYDDTALMYAARLEKLGAVQTLLETGANANAADQIGETPLHKLSTLHSNKVLIVMNELLAAGVDPNIKENSGGFNVLASFALQPHTYAEFKLLIDAGADKRAKVWDGSTAYDIAVLSNQPKDILELLKS